MAVAVWCVTLTTANTVHADYSCVIAGTTADCTGDAATDTFLVRETGGLLEHNRFTAGDPGFASNFDWDSVAGGLQTIDSVASTTNFIGIHTDAGADNVILGDGDADQLHTQFLIDNDGAAGVTLTIDYSASSTAQTINWGGFFILSGDLFITKIPVVPMNFVLRAGSGADVITISDGVPGDKFFVYSGAGDDTINVGDASTSVLFGMGGSTFDGEGGSDTLNYNDQADGMFQRYFVNAATLNRTGTVVSHAQVETFNLTTSTTVGTEIYVESIAPATAWTITGGAGDNEVHFGQAASLAAILSPVTISGGGGIDSLDFDDSINGRGHTYTLSSTGLVRSGNTIANLDGTFETVGLQAASANDTATITPSTTTSFAFYAGAHTTADALDIIGTGATTPSMTGTPANGQITFGNRQPVAFQLVESLLYNSTPAGGVFSVANATVNESAGPAVITVNRTGNTLGSAPVNYATSNGTATAGVDYTTASGTLAFVEGEVSKTFPVPLTDNLVIGPDRTVILTLSGAGGAAVLGAPPTGTLTIADDDAPTPTPTPTPTGTLVPTMTPTVTPTVTASPALTATPTPTPAPAPRDENKEDSRKPQTDEQRQQQQHTNRSNRDDTYTEGNVVEVGVDDQGPYLMIANRDGRVQVRLLCGASCPTVHPGDYVELDGAKEHEQLFYADEVTVVKR